MARFHEISVGARLEGGDHLDLIQLIVIVQQNDPRGRMLSARTGHFTRKVTVNVVAPTTVRTPMVVNESTIERDANGEPLSDDILGKRFAAHHPVPRPWIYPEDVAREVVHLVTEPGNITGTVIEIGLGQSAPFLDHAFA